MKNLFYILIAFIVLTSCGEYQNALKSDDVAVKYKLAEQLFKDGNYNKASRLFTQIIPSYRGKPQGQKLMYLDADSYFKMEQHYIAAYKFERFVKSYPKSEKAEESAYKSVISYAELSPVFSKDQEDTVKALGKLQEFANTYSDSEYLPKVNTLVKDLQYKLELKAYSTAKQYNHIEDYKASISDFENFITNFPGSKLREKALYYRFDSAYHLATKSIEEKKEERLNTAIAYFDGFKKSYSDSEFIEDAVKKAEDLEEQLQKI